MTHPLWLAAAAGLAIFITLFWYAHREERVRGRWTAAVLRALALFLILGGLFLPAFGRGGPGSTGSVVLLDTSRSMTLPASPRTTRLDSARAVVRSLAPDMIIGFGADAAQVPGDSVDGITATGGATRVAVAFETARRLGADSVVVVSDGEWEDRQLAVTLAERLGLGVREINVLEPPSRVGIRTLNVPRQMRSGDSVRIVVEVFAAGPELPDSITVELGTGGRTLTTERIAVPGSGRSSRVFLRFRPTTPAGDGEWRRYDVTLDTGADPYGTADARTAWAEVTRRATGVVLVVLTPDWEARNLLPVLRRASTAGAVGYVLTAPGRFVSMGPDPAAVPTSDVLADARAADLLVILGGGDRVPEELRAIAERQDRLLVFPGRAGPAIGTPLRLRDGEAGDWYLDETIVASPISGLLAGLAVDDVPPLTLLFDAEGPSTWTPLRARRNRQGSALPVMTGGMRGDERWVVATGAGYWRWAFRDGAPRQLYERTFTGVAGWLLENRVLRMVQLDSDPVAAARPVELRVAAGVERLRLVVRDSAAVVWTDSTSTGPAVRGPTLESGTYRLEARGMRDGTSFRIERPFEVVDASRELEPRDRAPELTLAATASTLGVGGAGRRRPVWPFLAAALLLCTEWAWRRRIGLR